MSFNSGGGNKIFSHHYQSINIINSQYLTMNEQKTNKPNVEPKPKPILPDNPRVLKPGQKILND